MIETNTQFLELEEQIKKLSEEISLRVDSMRELSVRFEENIKDINSNNLFVQKTLDHQLCGKISDCLDNAFPDSVANLNVAISANVATDIEDVHEKLTEK